jgi:ATP-dependent helicase/DNAse subunit B
MSLRLSVSKSKTFESCAKKYHFSYVLKLPRKEFSYHTFGKFVHKVLEDFHQLYLDGCDEPFNKTIGKCFKIALAEYGSKMDAEAKKEAFEIVNAYLKRITADKDSVKKVLSVEKKFDLEISPNVVLNGMIDRIQLDDDGIIHIADYKTSKSDRYLKKDLFQLLTYAYVLLQEDPTLNVIRGSYIMLRHNFKYITKDFNRDEILKVKDKYEKYAADIEAEKLWRPSPTILCSYCEFLDSCDSGSKFVKPQQEYGETSW